LKRSEEQTRLVAATANRLRLIQSDLADESPETRREHMGEVLERALAGVNPGEREAFLSELEEVFPSWDGNVRVAEEGPAAVAAPADQRELKDPSFLVARLAELAPTLTDVQRRVLTDRLREAGLAPKATGGAAWPDEPLEKFRAKVQMRESAPDSARLLELATILVEVASSLDQLTWNTWKTVAPRSALRRPAPLAQSMGRFVSGDAEVGRAQVAQDVERVRQLTAALISAVSQIGRQFAQGHLAKFSPNEIESLASMERSVLVSKEVRCWRKYVELAGALDESAIEAEIMQVLASYAESLMKGIRG
jgi:hypothetical protein